MLLFGKQLAMNKFHLLLVLVQVLYVVADLPVSYKGYRVYEVREDATKPPIRVGAIILKTSRLAMGDPFVFRTYLVPHHQEKDFITSLNSAGIIYNVLIQNVGQLMQGENLNKFRRTGEKPSHTEAYFSYDEIINRTIELSKKNNSATGQPLAIVEKIGKTYEKRDMYLVKISSNHSLGKPIAFIEAGMHAREWVSPSTALHIIYELVDNYNNTANKALLDNVDFYIIPVSNPDGYEYSRTTNRLWRKTRSRYQNGVGVDGNRNFDFHWGKHGSSNDPDDDTYGGPFAFSENETRHIRDVGQKYKNKICMFLSLHSYGSLLVYPWSFARTAIAPHTEEMRKAALAAAKAIEKYSGTKYTVGNSAQLMYDSPGGADDYFKAILHVEMAFTMEISDGGGGGFIVPAKKLEKIVKEAYEGIKALAQESYKYFKTHQKGSKRRRQGC